MAVLNPSWYNRNSQRRYPLHDGASATDDDGRTLPDDLLVDLLVRLPYALGPYLYLSALTVNRQLVTLLLLGSASATATQTQPYRPVAALHLPGPRVPGRAYRLEGLQEGAGGWVVLGPGLESDGSWRLRSPSQGLIAPRVVRLVRPQTVRSLGKEGLAQGLSGLVQLRAGPDLRLRSDDVSLEGRTYRAVFVGLASAAGRNVLEVYRGPCEPRPETQNCPRPPVESVSGVVPDCDGNLTIRWEGLTATDIPGGILLDAGTGLASACQANKLPDSSGRLPYQTQDDCATPTTGEPVADPVFIQEPQSLTVSESLAGFDCGELPFRTDLIDPTGDGMEVFSGSWSAGAEPSDASSASSDTLAAYGTTDTVFRHASLWNRCAFSDFRGKEVSCELSLGVGGSGGLLLNYRPAPVGAGADQLRYHLLDLDLASGRLRLRYYNGSRFLEQATLGPLRLLGGDWYRLVAQIDNGSPPTLAARVEGLTDPTVGASTSTPLSNFTVTDGLAGLGSDRGLVDFRDFRVALYP